MIYFYGRDLDRTIELDPKSKLQLISAARYGDLDPFRLLVEPSVLADWTVRPNPEGRILTKPEGRIFNHKAEMIKNGKAKFYHKAEYLSILITPQYINILFAIITT